MELLKSKKKMAIIGAALATVVALGGISMHANAAIKVNTYTVTKTDMEKVTEVNGNVVSDKSVPYYSDIDGKVASVNFKEGDFVKKGDIIVTYDSEELDRKIALADYTLKENNGNYDSVLQSGSRIAGLYYEANSSIADLDEKIAMTQAVIDITQNSLIERKAAIADEGAKLQVSLIDWADNPTSDEYENLQKLIAENQGAMQYDSELVTMQENLNYLTSLMTYYKEQKSMMASQKAATQTGMITQGTKDQIEAAKAASELSYSKTFGDYTKAKDGIKAEFDGIITGISVVPGDRVSCGSILFTLESLDDAVIKMDVNKYDILDMEIGQSAEADIRNKKYTGKIVRIQHMTGSNGNDTSAIGVEVGLDAPDDNIILGLETKVRVNTASLKDVLTVPVDALGIDESGDYVFVLNDKKAVKTRVETGTRNDDTAQIVSGISEGDIVVWSDDTELTDGMDVRAE